MGRNEALYQAALKGDRIAARDLTTKALDEGADPINILHETLIPAMRELGARFSEGAVVLPDLLVGARAAQASIELIEPALNVDKIRKLGKVCIGSVKGDNHDIGKNIVAMMLRSSGFEVIDLGVNCDIARYEEGVAAGAQAILCSCLNMSAAGYIREIAEHFSKKDAPPVIIGGAGVTKDFAREIGVHAYGANANEAVEIVAELLA